MKIGIIVPMAEEIILYREKLSATTTETIGGAEFTVGTYQDSQLVLAQSGIGKVQASMTATVLFDHFHVDALINTGSAAGVADGLTIGELVLGQQLAYHDVDVTNGGDYVVGQVPGQDLFFESDSQLLKVVQTTAAQLDLQATTGLIVTGDQFVANADHVATIKNNFNGVAAIEMEGAAVAQIATNFGKPFLIIRAISDNGDANATVNFDEFVKQAGKNAAELLLKAIPSIAKLEGNE